MKFIIEHVSKAFEKKEVLKEYPTWMEDFYIFPKNYLWLICHCDDGACMFRVWK